MADTDKLSMALDDLIKKDKKEKKSQRKGNSDAKSKEFSKQMGQRSKKNRQQIVNKRRNIDANTNGASTSTKKAAFPKRQSKAASNMNNRFERSRQQSSARRLNKPNTKLIISVPNTPTTQRRPRARAPVATSKPIRVRQRNPPAKSKAANNTAAPKRNVIMSAPAAQSTSSGRTLNERFSIRQ